MLIAEKAGNLVSRVWVRKQIRPNFTFETVSDASNSSNDGYDLDSS